MIFFNRSTLSDEAILAGIVSDGILQRNTENKLYEQYFYFIKDATFKHKISEDEVASLYTDSILAFIENVRSNRFQGNSAIKTYLYQIFSNKCVDFIRKTATNKMSVHETQSLDDSVFMMPDDAKNILQKLISENEVNVLKVKIGQLGEKCQQMVLAWSEGFSDSQIAQELGYQSANVAKTSRLRCLEKLRELYNKS
ncbi:MAG: sigma-70 family RNA polymerase sigma factor [Arcicella sp.]|nr:sigma-70 family RNA polymerase sigma factor [Arcicella sp.]